LKSQGRVGLAVLVLLPLALPALIYGLFLVMILVLQPDFR
jgi:ABC-type spermidine/putrescine transport system permease subunit II